MPPARRKPGLKAQRKLEAVLGGAREVFMALGYERASVERIARAAGVSKATIYAYFPDKRQLFSAMLRAEILRHADETEAMLDLDRPIEEILHDTALRILRFMISDMGLAFYRVCVAEAVRFPETGREFYTFGPLMLRQRLSAGFREMVRRGEMVVPDPEMAADQFNELCKTTVFDRALFGVGLPVTEAEIEGVARGVVALFLAQYGAPGRKSLRQGPSDLSR
ncbi:MAG: hypothetical protein RLZ26_2325 [Pseudomonadota bacterium]|jgi:AcrR family transcriptional regulator